MLSVFFSETRSFTVRVAPKLTVVGVGEAINFVCELDPPDFLGKKLLIFFQIIKCLIFPLLNFFFGKSGNVVQRLEWNRGNIELADSDRYKQFGANFELEEARLSDEGVFVCSAISDQQIVSDTGVVQIKGAEKTK